ncbi:methylenetetrahydrofolate reductase [Salinicola sp. DM10]|uniref:methylenetetrahydrofolate reductase n=1 Tax=Salinicola sp. DM10 TaxID=2815721 RepID=UPI001A8E5AAA|nr:methylenetetrahydrofolate reductase [Salinicola sp. DM10]MCE3026994.1 methylenetetrahydrofolate reductase [Salinicola sp. DM10]
MSAPFAKPKDAVTTPLNEGPCVPFIPLSQGYSIEATPKAILGDRVEWGAVPEGTRIFIPQFPKNTPEEMLACAKRLQGMGFKPIPHVTARRLADKREFERLLSKLVAEAAVDEILLLAGGDDTPHGQLGNTLELLESGVIERVGIRRIGVAGHPEGHPEATQDALDRALAIKNAFSVETGIPLYIVTQFFFDADPFIAWERRIREQGNRLPIHAGLPGLASGPSLLKHAMACGVGSSVKVLRRNMTGLRGLLGLSWRGQDPGRIVKALAVSKERDPASNLAGFHFYALGAFDLTVKWANRFAQTRG